MDKIRNYAALFYLLQGTGSLIWWIALFAHPRWRQSFLPPHCPATVLTALSVADFVLMIGGSLAAAFAIVTKRPWMAVCVSLQAGASSYSALYAIGLAIVGGGWLGAVLMSPCLIAGVVFVCLLTRDAVGAKAESC